MSSISLFLLSLGPHPQPPVLRTSGLLFLYSPGSLTLGLWPLDLLSSCLLVILSSPDPNLRSSMCPLVHCSSSPRDSGFFNLLQAYQSLPSVLANSSLIILQIPKSRYCSFVLCSSGLVISTSGCVSLSSSLQTFQINTFHLSGHLLNILDCKSLRS